MKSANVKLVRSKGREYRYFRPPPGLKRYFRETIRLPDDHDGAIRVAENILASWLSPDMDGRRMGPRLTSAARSWRIRNLQIVLDGCLKAAKKRAAATGQVCDIDFDYLVSLAERQEWACVMSGIKFRSTTKIGKEVTREPFRPSIDRIDNRLGYTKDNCRLVCVAVNVALGAWGDEVFLRVVRYTAARISRTKRRPILENARIVFQNDATDPI